MSYKPTSMKKNMTLKLKRSVSSNFISIHSLEPRPLELRPQERHSQEPPSQEPPLQEPPDGGLVAWLQVLGAFFLCFSSS